MSPAIIDKATFEKISPKSKDYLLLCFQTSSSTDAPILKTIKKAKEQFPQSLQTYIVPEEDWDFFQNKYKFWGTPIYILFKNGVEKERLLGKVSENILIKFISKNVV